MGKSQATAIAARTVVVLSMISTLAACASEPGPTRLPLVASSPQVVTDAPTSTAPPSAPPTDLPVESAFATTAPTVAASTPASTEPSPSPSPSQEATEPPALSLAFTQFTSPVSRGATATVSIKTLAGASCSIVVEYKSGPSKASGLGDTTASGSGVASWSWKIGSSTTQGSWPVTVACRTSAASGSIKRDVVVQ